MKTLMLIAFGATLLFGCQEQEIRYTQQSKEIEDFKKTIEAYEKMDWETMASFYADSAKISYNKLEKDAMTLSQLMEMNKKDATEFASWDYVDNESEFEMVVTDKGETWVNFWGIWKGNFKANGKTYTIPAHTTVRFVDGKIVEEFGYWDLSEFCKDRLATLEATDSITTQ